MLRNRPILVLLGWIVVLGVVYEFLLAPVLPHSWLSYSTRPLWDKSEAPVELVDHFERPGGEGRNGTEQWCGLHGWKARKEEVEVWDAVSRNGGGAIDSQE
jgi:beta-1,4-mannosyl-glycoprotein beta-1,4-N-acetylglucosaminyltransferase